MVTKVISPLFETSILFEVSPLAVFKRVSPNSANGKGSLLLKKYSAFALAVVMVYLSVVICTAIPTSSSHTLMLETVTASGVQLTVPVVSPFVNSQVNSVTETVFIVLF